MKKTGVRTDVFLELCAEESGGEALIALLVSAYALPFPVRTPVQMVLRDFNDTVYPFLE